MPDNEPPPVWSEEPGDIWKTNIREVTMNLRKDIGSFQSALRTEMQAYIEKIVGEVCTICS